MFIYNNRTLYHVRLITYNSCFTSPQPSPYKGEGAVPPKGGAERR